MFTCGHECAFKIAMSCEYSKGIDPAKGANQISINPEKGYNL